MSVAAKKRPKHLNLLKIRLPIPGVTSILHRISGAGMIVMLPVVLYFLDRSLASPEGYAGVVETLSHPFLKLIALGLSWALLHHLFAGIRFLLLDLHLGVDLQPARASAWAATLLAAAGALVVAAMLFA